MVPPSRKRFVTYYRVSREKKDRNGVRVVRGLGIEAQKAAAQAYLQQHAGIEVDTYEEVESGKIDERPELQKALLRCRQTHSTLLVAKLDRLSRNTVFLLTLRDSGVKFVALDLPEANTLTLTVMAALAQQEREMISARTKAALAALRASGKKLGTPRNLGEYRSGALQREAGRRGAATIAAKARRRVRDIQPVIEEARRTGVHSLRKLARYLNDREIPTPRGCSWTPTAVRSALRLLAV